MNGSRRRLPALVVGMALLVAACGDDDDDGAASGGGTAGDQDLQGQQVEVAATWSGEEQARFSRVLERFEEETGATVQFTSTGDDIATVLGTRLAGGSPPDVAMLPQPGLLNDLAGRNALQPIEEVAGSLVDENYAPVWRQLGSVDGTLFGVWFKAANKSTFWYNNPVFESAGVETPETWEDLQTVAQTISDSGVTPFSVGGADGWTLTDWFENVYLRVAGPEKYDQLATHAIPWTDPSVTEALSTLAEVFGQQQWIAGGANGALGTDFPRSVTQVFSEPPAAAMVYEGDFVAGLITSETTATLGEDARFFDFPAIDGSDPAVVGGGDVAVLLKDSPGGRALVRFLATPEAAEEWASEGGFTSPNQALDLEAYADDTTRRSAEALTEAETFRFDLSDLQPAAFGGTPGQGMWKILQDFLRNTGDVNATAAALEAARAAAGD